MSQIFHLPEDIRQEFSIDEKGKAYASQSAIARLCGVTQQAINKLLLQLKGTTKPVSESLEPFTGIDYMATTKIPDIVVAAIINHYAMYARKTTEEAKKVSLCFQAIGIRTWIQTELGWQQEKPQLSLEDTITLANFASTTAQNAGVSKALAETIKLESIMQIAPQAKPLLQPQKQAITSAHPLTETAVTPTIIGQRLATKLGHPKISSRAINKKLLALGYQTSVTRIKKSTGREVHDYYRPTEKTLNGNHGQLEMTSYQDGTGKNTKYQLRWFNTIVEILANNWEVKS
ncbi:MAG: hypothetical protein AAGA80_12685 [Cyanobacteria bacterium P01_F01_bin.143]